MQLIGLGFATVLTVYANEIPVRTERKGAKDLSESEMEALTSRYKCPKPKRPWQYWPLGCHHRHSELQEDQELANLEWQQPGNNICTYYKRCLKNCRGVKSSNNQCIDSLTQVLTRGIKCNCKCSFACIERLNEIIEEHAGDEDATNNALLMDNAIVEVSDDGLMKSLSDDIEDSSEGLILDISEDDDDSDDSAEFTPDSILERSGQLNEDYFGTPTGRNALGGGPVDLSHFKCEDEEMAVLTSDNNDRCHDYNWCHAEKFPCKYPCSRRCKQCLQQCPPCNCPQTGLADGRECPDPVDVMTHNITMKDTCP